MVVRLKVNDNGSLRVEADSEEEVVLLDGKGVEYKLNGRKVFGVCRCGATKNAPFCDGSHKTCGFQSCVVAVELPEKKV